MLKSRLGSIVIFSGSGLSLTFSKEERTQSMSVSSFCGPTMAMTSRAFALVCLSNSSSVFGVILSIVLGYPVTEWPRGFCGNAASQTPVIDAVIGSCLIFSYSSLCETFSLLSSSSGKEGDE